MLKELHPHHHTNPHAHAIHTPGKRLMHQVPLEFVWRKVQGHGKRAVGANLNYRPPILTSRTCAMAASGLRGTRKLPGRRIQNLA